MSASPHDWVARVALVCPAHLRADAAETAAAMSGNEADASDEGAAFYSRALADLYGEVTHYLAVTAVRRSTLAALPWLEAHFPGAIWWVVDWYDDEPYTGDVVSLADGLAAHGLRLVEEEGDE
jgi:hypothetical protein